MAQVTCNMASNLASCRLHPSTSASRTGQYRPKNYSVGENERFSVRTAIIGGLGARIGLCAIRIAFLARGCRGATQVSSREHLFQQVAEYQHQLPEPQPSRSSKSLHCVRHAKASFPVCHSGLRHSVVVLVPRRGACKTHCISLYQRDCM